MNKHSTRNWMPLCAIAVFLAIGSRVAVGAVTNVSMVAHFTLSGFKGDQSSAAAAFKITNKDILQALNDTGQFNFSSSAEIVFLSFEGELPSIAVRQRNGSDVTTTDVSSLFFITEPLEVHAAHKVSYAIYIYNFDTQNGTSFAAGGMTTLHGGTITGPGIGPLDRDKTLT